MRLIAEESFPGELDVRGDALVDALTKARKDYSLVLLPGQKHGPKDPASRLYVNQRVLEFFEKNL